MKKTFLAITALAAMLFAGCTSSDELTTLESIKTADNTPTPVQFGTYVGKGQTRATVGKTGAMNDTELQKSEANGGGFGVFAYYTGNDTWSSIGSSTKPNFMYNQGVFYNTSKWEYTPVKYWPNDNTTADNSGAAGTTTSKISFFASLKFI